MRSEYAPFLIAALDSVWPLTSTASLSQLPGTGTFEEEGEQGWDWETCHMLTCSEKGSKQSTAPFTVQTAETIQACGDMPAW